MVFAKKVTRDAGQTKTLISGYKFITAMPEEEMRLGTQELRKLDRALYDKIEEYIGVVIEMALVLGNRVGRDQLEDISFYLGNMLKATAFLAIKDNYKKKIAKRSDSSQWAMIARPPDQRDPNYDSFVALENEFDIHGSTRHKYPFMNALFAPQNLLNGMVDNEYLPRYDELRGRKSPAPGQFSSSDHVATVIRKTSSEREEIEIMCVPYQEEILVMLHQAVSKNVAKKELASLAR